MIPVYEVVSKLIGPVSTVGETRTDDIRFENLKDLIALADKLIDDICDVARYDRNRHEYSRKRSGDYASAYLKRLHSEIDDDLF